jgi:DNA polymerase-3 subunit epsilon
MNFIAIDFETADESRYNPCEIGITLVQDWKIIEFYSWLIRPSCWPNFAAQNIRVHNITPDEVKNCLTFDQLWPQIRYYFEQNPVVAHNAKFDLNVLNKTLEYYQIKPIQFRHFDSLELSQEAFPALPSHSLDTVCHLLGIELTNHHCAGPDAKATAEIIIKICKNFGIHSIDELDKFCEGSQNFAAMRRSERKQEERMAFVLGDRYGFKIDKEKNHIVYTGDIPDPKNKYFDKLIAFTGFTNDRELNYSEILDKIGGTFKKGTVTLKTDYLVVSMDYWNNQTESGKLKKAKEYSDRGLSIQIISEEEFLSNIQHTIKNKQ